MPARVRRIVLHTPGGPDYDNPLRRWSFLSPRETQALWRKPRFGTHWILWTDGSIWPRHTRPAQMRSYTVPVDGAVDEGLRGRIAREAAPVYSHVQGANADTLGIEVAHSGRSDAPFEPAQVRALVRFLQTLLDMSHGRLTPASIMGHKDLDPHPAYVYLRCEHPRCPVFVDPEGRPYRRRLDPPESLFASLASEGLVIPRPAGEPDADLVRAERTLGGGRPKVARR